MELTRRYRVNVSTSVKGIKSFDCTVEITADNQEDPLVPEQIRAVILQESDELVAGLDKRYKQEGGSNESD